MEAVYTKPTTVHQKLKPMIQALIGFGLVECFFFRLEKGGGEGRMESVLNALFGTVARVSLARVSRLLIVELHRYEASARLRKNLNDIGATQLGPKLINKRRKVFARGE